MGKSYYVLSLVALSCAAAFGRERFLAPYREQQTNRLNRRQMTPTAPKKKRGRARP